MSLRSMDCITFSSSIFLLIASSSYALEFGINPIIIVHQGVIADNNLLPVYIFWYHSAFIEGDILLVYSSDSRREYAHHMIESVTGLYELPREILENGEKSGKYCAAMLSRMGALYKSPSCRSKAEWMYDRRILLQKFTLRDLVIPGTHQSGACGKLCNGTLDENSYMSRWILCQTKTIKTQLMEGIRYVDLRPGFMYIDGVKKYIVTHSVFKISWMDDIVEQINEFLAVSRDVVIVSFKEFAMGFNSEKDHLDFIKYLEESFKRYAHPHGYWTYTLDEFWTSGKRLVLAYDHITSRESDILWSAIPQYWAEGQTINRLHSYLREVLQQDPHPFRPWALMSVLTHSFTSIVQDAMQGDMSIRHWAQRVGRCIPQWLIEESNHTDANIIAVDFYETSGIVDFTIQLNEKRAERSRSRYLGIYSLK